MVYLFIIEFVIVLLIAPIALYVILMGISLLRDVLITTMIPKNKDGEIYMIGGCVWLLISVVIAVFHYPTYEWGSFIMWFIFSLPGVISMAWTNDKFFSSYIFIVIWVCALLFKYCTPYGCFFLGDPDMYSDYDSIEFVEEGDLPLPPTLLIILVAVFIVALFVFANKLNRVIAEVNMRIGFYLYEGKMHDGWSLVKLWIDNYAYVRYDLNRDSAEVRRKYLNCEGEETSYHGSIFIYAENFSDGVANVVEYGKPADIIDRSGRSMVKLGYSEKSGTISEHDYVDLGLSVKWAMCNVGASKPEQYGDYYAWGETETKSSYDEDNCETWEKSIGDIGGTVCDVAHVKWGGTWRLPTRDEFQELIDNCTWTWTTLNGVKGSKFTSKKNGKSIFLPAAGWRYGTSLSRAGSNGYYWSSTPGEGNTQCAYYLNFSSVDHDWLWGSRGLGRSVRPVSE